MRFRVCFDLTHLLLEELLCCMIVVVEMPGMYPNRSFDEIDIMKLKKRHLIGFSKKTYYILVAFLSDTKMVTVCI